MSTIIILIIGFFCIIAPKKAMKEKKLNQSEEKVRRAVLLTRILGILMVITWLFGILIN